MSLLAIYLPITADKNKVTQEWPFVGSEDRLTLTRQGVAAAPLLPSTGRSDEVVAVVPLQALSWHQVQLPNSPVSSFGRLGSSSPLSRGQALLEGLLEEQLLSSPQELHLALGPAVATQAVPGEPLRHWVAAVDRAWLTRALESLENQGVSVHRIVPEVWPEQFGHNASPALLAAQGAQQAEWVVLGQAPVLRWPLQTEGQPRLPPHWLLGKQAIQSETSAIDILAEPALASAVEQALAAQNPHDAPAHYKLRLQTAAQRWLDATNSPWNLAQNQLARSPRDRLLKTLSRLGNTLLNSPEWSWPRRGLLALVLTQIVGLNVQAWQIRQDQNHHQAEMRAWLSSTFPSVQAVVDAPLQMKRELDRLRQSRGEIGPADLESLLDSVQNAVAGQHPPQEIEYSPGLLKLRGMSLNPQELNALAQRLKAKGLIVSQQGEQLVVQTSGALEQP